MKKSWMPAAFMGTLGLGYAAGAAGRETRIEVQPAPVVSQLPAAPARELIPLPAPATPLPMEPIVPTLPVGDGAGPYPAWNGVDLNCPDVGHPVRVINGYDPHGLDRDGDGIGCDR